MLRLILACAGRVLLVPASPALRRRRASKILRDCQRRRAQGTTRRRSCATRARTSRPTSTSTPTAATCSPRASGWPAASTVRRIEPARRRERRRRRRRRLGRRLRRRAGGTGGRRALGRPADADHAAGPAGAGRRRQRRRAGRRRRHADRSPATVGLSAGRHTLPASLIVALVLLGLAAASAAVPLARRCRPARRATETLGRRVVARGAERADGAPGRRADAGHDRAPAARGAGLAIAAGVAIALVVAAFVAQRRPAARAARPRSEIGFMLAGAALAARRDRCAARARADAPCYGGDALGAVALLAVLTALSITWSLAPRTRWLEADRTLAYLAAFAGALALVRLAPGRWSAVLARRRARLRRRLRLGAADQGLPRRARRPTRPSPACASRSATGTPSG